LRRPQDRLGKLHAGEVIEISASNVPIALEMLRHICHELHLAHLNGVSVGTLMTDSGTPI
jgi:hypothetical protein